MSNVQIIFRITVLLAFFVFALHGNESASESSKTTKLKCSVSIDKIQYLADGGTTDISLTDEKGKKHNFYFDGSLVSKAPSCIYYVSDSTTKKMAHLVPIGSALEKKLLALIFKWLDQHYTIRRQEEVQNKSSIANLSEKDLKAFRLLKAIEGQRNTAKARRWLDNNYSPAQLRWLLTRLSGDGLSKKDSLAWHTIQALHGYPAHTKRKK